jgi:hypothetical protein
LDQSGWEVWGRASEILDGCQHCVASPDGVKMQLLKNSSLLLQLLVLYTCIQGDWKVLLTLGHLHISTGDIPAHTQKLVDIRMQRKRKWLVVGMEVAHQWTALDPCEIFHFFARISPWVSGYVRGYPQC